MITKKRSSGAAVRRAANREQMQTAILDTARTIVTDNGIDALTIRAVAQELSYSPGAIYDYFESKEDILNCLYFAGANGLGARMEQVIADSPPGTSAIEQLITLSHAYRAHALANRELYRLIFGGIKDVPAPPGHEVSEEEIGGYGTLIRLARHGIAEGSIIDIPIQLIAHAVWAAVHGFVSLELQGHITGGAPGTPAATEEIGQQRRDEMFDTVMRMMLVGLVTEQFRSTMPALAGTHVLPEMGL